MEILILYKAFISWCWVASAKCLRVGCFSLKGKMFGGLEVFCICKRVGLFVYECGMLTVVPRIST